MNLSVRYWVFESVFNRIYSCQYGHFGNKVSWDGVAKDGRVQQLVVWRACVQFQALALACTVSASSYPSDAFVPK